MSRTVTLAALALIVLQGAAHAQADTSFVIPRIPPGTVVRVWTSESLADAYVGEIEPGGNDTLRLRLYRARLAVPVAGVERVDQRMARTSGQGALRGFALSLFTAFLFDMLVFTVTTGSEGIDPYAGAGAVILTPVIVIGGTLIGAAKPGSFWKTVYQR